MNCNDSGPYSHNIICFIIPFHVLSIAFAKRALIEIGAVSEKGKEDAKSNHRIEFENLQKCSENVYLSWA